MNINKRIIQLICFIVLIIPGQSAFACSGDLSIVIEKPDIPADEESSTEIIATCKSATSEALEYHNVRFTIDPLEGIIDPEKSTTDSDGKAKTTYTSGKDPKRIKVSARADILGEELEALDYINIFNICVENTSSNIAVVNKDNELYSDFNIEYKIEPLEYIAKTADIDILDTNDTIVATYPCSEMNGSGNKTWNAGDSFSLSPGKYKVKLILNKEDADLKYESDAFDFKVFQVYLTWKNDVTDSASIVPVKDGITGGPYSVEVKPEAEYTTVQYNWSGCYESIPPSNAGNYPMCDFKPYNAQSTEIQGPTLSKWFAYPDSADDCKQACSYNIWCKVTINASSESIQIITNPLELKVKLPKLGAETHAELVGIPSVDFFVDKKGRYVYFVSGKNSLRRIIKQDFSLSNNSQFMIYEKKIPNHEAVHYRQYTFGIAKDLWSVEGFWKMIKKLKVCDRDKSKAEKIIWEQINRNRILYDSAQAIKLDKLEYKMEKEAYAVSDDIPPFYFYTWNKFLKVYWSKKKRR